MRTLLNTFFPLQPNFGSNILRSVSVLYTGDHDECRAKLFSSFKDGTLDPSFNLDEEHQKCIIGEYGKDACVVSSCAVSKVVVEYIYIY